MVTDNKAFSLFIMLLILIIDAAFINEFTKFPVILSIISIFLTLGILGVLINSIVNKKIPVKSTINYFYIYLIILFLFNLKESLNMIESNKKNKELSIKHQNQISSNQTPVPISTPVPVTTIENIAYVDRFDKEYQFLLITEKTTIYSKKNLTDSIGEAEINDIFRTEKAEKDIYKVFLFSGDYRYIKIKKPKIIKFENTNLPNIELQKEIFKSLVLAQDCSQYFTEVVKANAKYQRYLSDMFQLQTIRKYSLSYNPLIFKKISSNGIDFDWSMGLYNENINLCGNFSI